LRNAQVAPIEVDDPYEEGAKIVVLQSTQHDPLPEMISKARSINTTTSRGGIGRQPGGTPRSAACGRSIRPGRRSMAAACRKCSPTPSAVRDLKAGCEALGQEGHQLICDVLGRGMSITQAAGNRGLQSETDRKYAGKRFRECLSTLAIRFGYANREARS
jgi:hypothetical protein